MSARVYQLKITLEEVDPPVWRRVQVPDDITLARLHRVVSLSMGWEDSHLHDFTVEGVEYGVPPPPDEPYPRAVLDERRYQLSDLVGHPGATFAYRYDYGDGWRHQVMVESIAEPEPDRRYPVCIGGGRACPPEDCGGPWGYAELVKALADPEHEQHQELSDWAGPTFDPEAFDTAIVNRRLSLRRL